ncbi:hypothetical protein BDR07DRAFT_1422376 [Suillus spraguei]|nr:hypothetical protein BDR07DRAFT_1422376 [Suillus spraguei]
MMITMLSGLKFTIGTEPTKLNQSYVRARCHLYNFKFLTLNLIETSDRTTAYQKRKQQLFRHRCLYLDRANKIEGTTSPELSSLPRRIQFTPGRRCQFFLFHEPILLDNCNSLPTNRYEWNF